MERPNPTKQFLLELCGENQGLISSAHHGFHETPSLRGFYSHLDFDEIFAFAASSWKGREKGNLHILDIDDTYDIFSNVLEIGAKWLNGNRSISPELQETYQKMNPFHRKNFKARLERVHPDDVIKLRKELRDEVNEYVFSCQYRARKAARDGDNYKLEIMDFQAVYPRRGKIVPAFASEIARIFKDHYSREHEAVYV